MCIDRLNIFLFNFLRRQEIYSFRRLSTCYKLLRYLFVKIKLILRYLYIYIDEQIIFILYITVIILYSYITLWWYKFLHFILIVKIIILIN